jgi:hypothetical protein
MPYTVSGNILKLSDYTGYLDGDSTSPLIAYFMEFSREGSGSGLEGLWKFTGYSYEVVTGTLTEAQKDTLDAEMQDENEDMDFMGMELQFASGKLSIYYNEEGDYGYDQAQSFIDKWNGEYYDDPSDADSARYNITVQKINATTVRLTGNKTNEIVTISFSDESTVYTSSVAANAAHTYYYEPVQCPNDYTPDWFYDFKTDNMKTTSLYKGLDAMVRPKKANGAPGKLKMTIDRLKSATLIGIE